MEAWVTRNHSVLSSTLRHVYHIVQVKYSGRRSLGEGNYTKQEIESGRRVIILTSYDGHPSVISPHSDGYSGSPKRCVVWLEDMRSSRYQDDSIKQGSIVPIQLYIDQIKMTFTLSRLSALFTTSIFTLNLGSERTVPSPIAWRQGLVNNLDTGEGMYNGIESPVARSKLIRFLKYSMGRAWL